MKHFYSMYTAGTVYTSFVLPILDYCVTMWSCRRSVNADKLQKLQRRAARIVMRVGSSEKALNFLGYGTLEKRRERHVPNLVKKCLSNCWPQFCMHYFNYNKDVLPRRTIMVVYFLITFRFRRRIQGEGCNPSFGKFSNLSGYPCLSLFHTKNNIISYNISSSPIDQYKKFIPDLFLTP